MQSLNPRADVIQCLKERRAKLMGKCWQRKQQEHPDYPAENLLGGLLRDPCWLAAALKDGAAIAGTKKKKPPRLFEAARGGLCW